MTLADQRCQHMNLLPVVIRLCSPALASSCNFSTAKAASQIGSAALFVMSLQDGHAVESPFAPCCALSSADL